MLQDPWWWCRELGVILRGEKEKQWLREIGMLWKCFSLRRLMCLNIRIIQSNKCRWCIKCTVFAKVVFHYFFKGLWINWTTFTNSLWHHMSFTLSKYHFQSNIWFIKGRKKAVKKIYKYKEEEIDQIWEALIWEIVGFIFYWKLKIMESIDINMKKVCYSNHQEVI